MKTPNPGFPGKGSGSLFLWIRECCVLPTPISAMKAWRAAESEGSWPGNLLLLRNVGIQPTQQASYLPVSEHYYSDINYYYMHITITSIKYCLNIIFFIMHPNIIICFWGDRLLGNMECWGLNLCLPLCCSIGSHSAAVDVIVT